MSECEHVYDWVIVPAGHGVASTIACIHCKEEWGGTLDETLISEHAALKREIVWLLQNEPLDNLGMYTQTKRKEWCARRDALLVGCEPEDVACAKCGELIDGCECEDGFFFKGVEDETE